MEELKHMRGGARETTVNSQVVYPGRLAAHPAVTERGIELATTLPGDHVAFHVAGDEDLIHCPALESIHDL
jgi:hypothetical protein